jgi:hypothetical protein
MLFFHFFSKLANALGFDPPLLLLRVICADPLDPPIDRIADLYPLNLDADPLDPPCLNMLPTISLCDPSITYRVCPMSVIGAFEPPIICICLGPS